MSCVTPLIILQRKNFVDIPECYRGSYILAIMKPFIVLSHNIYCGLSYSGCKDKGSRFLVRNSSRFFRYVVTDYLKDNQIVFNSVDVLRYFRKHDLNDFFSSCYNFLVCPCGHCLNCALDKSRDTAVRSYHESLCYSKSVFITLTVDDEHMEEVFPNGELRARPWQLFMKRLRKEFKGIDYIPEPQWFNPDHKDKHWNDYPIRTLMCAEYGGKTLRPHYHAALFNFDFPDKRIFRYKNIKGHKVKYYISDILSRLWPYGIHTIGDFTLNTGGYIGRYVCKKLFKDARNSDKEYFRVTVPSGIDLESRYNLSTDKFYKFSDNVYIFKKEFYNALSFSRSISDYSDSDIASKVRIFSPNYNFIKSFKSERVKEFIDPLTGVVSYKRVEFMRFPYGFALGKMFLFNKGGFESIFLNGSNCCVIKDFKGHIKKLPVPRYYIKQLQLTFPDIYDKLISERTRRTLSLCSDYPSSIQDLADSHKVYNFLDFLHKKKDYTDTIIYNNKVIDRDAV